MTKTLIIAEKPSVANDIAKALGGFTKHDEYFESDEYVLSSAVGHLLEIAVPEEYDVKRGKWTLRPPAGDPAALRAESDRQDRIAPEGADQADQAQRRHRPDQRLRRRARRRADFPPDRAARQGQATDQAPVAAVDDAGRDPRRLRQAAQRRGNAAAGRCRALPLRSRLADRHQRHARHDRVQFEGRRLLPDHRRPGADADPGDRGRARREDQEIRAARLTGKCAPTSSAPPASTKAAGSTPSSRRTRTTPRNAPSACGSKAAAEAIVAACRGKPGNVTEESKPTTADVAGAVRPDQPAARSQRPLRLFGQEHAAAWRRRCTKSTRC